MGVMATQGLVTHWATYKCGSRQHVHVVTDKPEDVSCKKCKAFILRASLKAAQPDQGATR
jgi:hypothetical protein